MRDGQLACSGWLVGSEGHFLTNAHCIANAQEAIATTFEFGAEGDCSEPCDSWLACPGTVVVSGAEWINVPGADTLDFALVKLPKSVPATFGHLRIRNGSPVKERIYIPQHPSGFGKKVAVLSGSEGPASGYAQVRSTSIGACWGDLNRNNVGYLADTDTGSSGSPVIAYVDHMVIALHECPGCPNTGIPMALIVPKIRGFIPSDSIVDP